MSFQTPGGPAAKRRRIEAANITLRKPFRSPLIHRPPAGSGSQDQQQQQQQQQPTTDADRTSSTASATPHTPATPASSRNVHPGEEEAAIARTSLSRGGSTSASAPSPLASRAEKDRHSKHPPLPRVANFASRPSPRSLPPSSLAAATSGSARADNRSSGGSSSSNNNNNSACTDADALLRQIQASQRHLALQVRAAQQRLELVQQARRIEEASRANKADAGLRERIAKWKAASRLAAEELFELVRERAEGMGGARAWRENERRKARSGGFWADEDGQERGGERDEDGEERDEEEDDEEETKREEEEEEGEEFTMAMMLKSLNIDPDVLGWDAGEGKWRD
ncbi:hypothetical protein VTJ83DRAFT_620 [Remersonia thermophila]|uniref:Swi5-dependent recombination DNA repair protein 1 n=1 Tax=Remersonia thermophila TaxID=72144 RepID=A0ABR4DMC4_9PEZI